MFISKMKLSRRTVLRGMGATLALPLLEAMVPALTAAPTPIARFGAIFTPLGQRPGYWEPKTVGRNFEFNTIMKPAEAFRDHLTGGRSTEAQRQSCQVIARSYSRRPKPSAGTIA
jgi:hypothetical protein